MGWWEMCVQTGGNVEQCLRESEQKPQTRYQTVLGREDWEWEMEERE